MLFVGSCFADNIGKRFVEDRFNAEVNPYGVMYNPASILHTIEKTSISPDIAVFTLGTNHIYKFKESGEIVDNCKKLPQSLFVEEELTIEQCVAFLSAAINILLQRNAQCKVIITVSPIRYAKYGYHNSALSKAVLLLAADKLAKQKPNTVYYFPAYEIVNDELRDYRFYKEDMLHPTEQTANYIYHKLQETLFSEETKRFISEWKPIKEALNHKPFDETSENYKQFKQQTLEKLRVFEQKYNLPAIK